MAPIGSCLSIEQRMRPLKLLALWLGNVYNEQEALAILDKPCCGSGTFGTIQMGCMESMNDTFI